MGSTQNFGANPMPHTKSYHIRYMSRFVQETHKKKPDKKPQATLPKPGSYTSKQLKMDGRNIFCGGNL